ncbi:hypothetical protein TRVL_09127 [Trypanosoma vivax]|nr:hypothetical protein TRVL_09127 [Trypanosoma vivax]
MRVLSPILTKKRLRAPAAQNVKSSRKKVSDGEPARRCSSPAPKGPSGKRSVKARCRPKARSAARPFWFESEGIVYFYLRPFSPPNAFEKISKRYSAHGAAITNLIKKSSQIIIIFLASKMPPKLCILEPSRSGPELFSGNESRWPMAQARFPKALNTFPPPEVYSGSFPTRKLLVTRGNFQETKSR